MSPKKKKASSSGSKREYLALIVDDNQAILDASRDYFKNHGLHALTATTVKEAIRHVKSTPALDLVITDVDLNPDPDANDTGGVTVAKEVRKIRHSLPILAYTAHKEQDFNAPVDWEVFNEAVSKGGGWSEIERNLEVCLKYASEYRESRVSTAKDQLARLQQKYHIPDYDISMLRSFLPGRHVARGKAASADPEEAGNADELLRSAGYQLHLIEAGRAIGDAEVGYAVTSIPIPIWIKKEGNTHVAELYGHPCIYAEGESEHAAMTALTMLMCGYYQDLKNEAALGAELRQLKEYLVRALGNGNAAHDKRGS